MTSVIAGVALKALELNKPTEHGHHVDLYCNIPVSEEVYCVNPKTVNTRIIFGILLCCEEKANQMQDGKTARCNGN